MRSDKALMLINIAILIAIIFLIIIALRSKKSDNYQPLAVKSAVGSPQPVLPTVNEKPVVEHSEFNIYEASMAPGHYFIVPAAIYVVQSEPGKLLGVSMERRDGNHFIFTSLLAAAPDITPRALSELKKVTGRIDALQIYPVDQISMRLLTDPQTPQDILITVIPSPQFLQAPYSALFTIQSSNKADISALKGLLKLENGFILEGLYTILLRTQKGDVKVQRSIKAIIGGVEIGSLSV